MAKTYNRAGVLTSTTGTGPITLGAAIAAGASINSCGFQTFSASGAADGEILPYLILDANGAWEYGTCTVSAGVLTRTLGQSSTGSLLNLSGSAQVFITLRRQDIREVIDADRTYYVRTDGSDSNTGLVNNAGGAFLTIGHALAVAVTLDCGGFGLTIQIGAGTFTENLNLSTPIPGLALLSIVGADASGSTVITSSSGITLAISHSVVGIGNVEIRSNGDNLFVFEGGVVGLGAGFRMGTGGNAQFSLASGGIVYADAFGYELVGSASTHLYLSGNCLFEVYNTVTITGSLSFGNFIELHGGAYFEGTGPFTGGTVTARRYAISQGGIAQTLGGGPNFFPGNVAGTGGTTAGEGFYA